MSICDFIKKKYIRLSKGQRKVAQFVVDNPNIIASQVASEVGRLAGVSESTVIRFCYAMDLAGFSELQEKIREYIAQNGGALEPKRKIVMNSENYNSCNDVMARDIKEISHTLQDIDIESFEDAVQLVHHAKGIHILGFSQSAPAAHWLHNNLSMLRNQVHLIQPDGRVIAQQLEVMEEGSVLLVISLKEEYGDIIELVELAKRKNVKIIAVSDKPLSDLPGQANVQLTVAAVNEEGITCTIAVFSLLHAIVECVVHKDKNQYKKHLEMYKEVRHEQMLTEMAIG